MKLNRFTSPDGLGKYALIEIKKLSSDERSQLKLKPTAGSIGNILAFPIAAINSGEEDPFFVIKLDDKFATPAINAYAAACYYHAQQLDKDEATKAEAKELFEFSASVMDMLRAVVKTGTYPDVPRVPKNHAELIENVIHEAGTKAASLAAERAQKNRQGWHTDDRRIPEEILGVLSKVGFKENALTDQIERQKAAIAKGEQDLKILEGLRRKLQWEMDIAIRVPSALASARAEFVTNLAPAEIKKAPINAWEACQHCGHKAAFRLNRTQGRQTFIFCLSHTPAENVDAGGNIFARDGEELICLEAQEMFRQRAEQSLPVREHILKTDPQEFAAVKHGYKTFEIRFNDRGYQVGDILVLRKTRYTGEEMKAGKPLEYEDAPLMRVVTHVMEGPRYGLAEPWVILSIAERTVGAAENK